MVRTEKKLVESAAQAVHRVLCSYRYDLCPHNEPLPRDRAAAQAALTAINLPQMLEVIAAARANHGNNEYFEASDGVHPDSCFTCNVPWPCPEGAALAALDPS